MFLHSNLGLKPSTVMKIGNISRATFYRYKKRLNNVMVKAKRQ